MPLDGSGNYTLPPAYNVTTGTVIGSTPYKQVLEDIRTALNLSVYRDGRASFSAPQPGVPGTASNHLVTKAQLDAATVDRALGPIKFTLVPPLVVSANVTLATTDETRPIIINSTSGAVTITLPDASAGAGFTLGPFQWIAGNNTVTLSCAPSDTINGSATYVMPFGSAITLVSTGIDSWQALGLTDPQDITDQALGEPEASIASAATTDVLAAASINVAVSGVASVTSFGTRPNRYRRIRATGAWTMVHNATTLICPTAQNITLAAGDIVEIRSDASGNVRVLSVSRGTGAPLAPAATGSFKRHTVLNAPHDGFGNPTFIPASSGTLTLTAQNITSTAPLVVTWSQGFATFGPSDSHAVIAANPSWTGLTASSLCYLWIENNAGNITYGHSVLAPIYQRGGAISVVAGQHTFDISDMVMYVGNGATASPVNRVFVGSASTGAASVTSALAYAIRGKAIFSGGSAITITGGALVTVNHNIGVRTPAGTRPEVDSSFSLQCVIAELGWSVGDFVDLIHNYTGGFHPTVEFDVTETLISYRNGNAGIVAPSKGASVMTTVTAANWRYYFVFERTF